MSKNSNNNDSGSTASLRSGNAGVSSSGPQNGIVLGGLFASGMPKLKATGRLGMFYILYLSFWKIIASNWFVFNKPHIRIFREII